MSIDRFEALRVFCRIVEAGSFTRTAQQLEMSNSSVTNHLTNLEGHLGVRLLHRTTRKLSLTDEGRACYAQARELLDGLCEMEESLSGATQVPKGVLRIPELLHVLNGGCQRDFDASVKVFLGLGDGCDQFGLMALASRRYVQVLTRVFQKLVGKQANTMRT